MENFLRISQNAVKDIDFNMKAQSLSPYASNTILSRYSETSPLPAQSPNHTNNQTHNKFTRQHHPQSVQPSLKTLPCSLQAVPSIPPEPNGPRASTLQQRHRGQIPTYPYQPANSTIRPTIMATARKNLLPSHPARTGPLGWVFGRE